MRIIANGFEIPSVLEVMPLDSSLECWQLRGVRTGKIYTRMIRTVKQLKVAVDLFLGEELRAEGPGVQGEGS